MRWIWKIGLLGALVGGGAMGYRPAREYWSARNKVSFETKAVSTGDMVRLVNSTGEIKPVLSVSVGSFVSGPITDIYVDFNDEVKKGDALARVDPRTFDAAVLGAKASLSTSQAQLENIEAQLRQAVNNYQRGMAVREKNRDYLSDREMDQLTFQVKSFQAQRRVARASIEQAQASLQNAQTNLDFCEIVAPVDGIVIDRKIDPGQTLAAQFQTPELFVVAPDLRDKVHVFASVDEADIGLIQKAFREKRPVKFTVDAHPDDEFEGQIEQIRVSSVKTSNVVTYPVVIAVANPDLKLLPGMTAYIDFEVDSVGGAVLIPNAALRFFPTNVEWVCEEDRKLVDGSNWKNSGDEGEKKGDEGDDDRDEDDKDQDKDQKTGEDEKGRKTHVWRLDGEKLRAIEVVVGLGDSEHTECVQGDLKSGVELVTAVK
ncbi:MAG: efflux RND transporter periplasmic adaptor subunit [Planctomycetota bacterium]